MGPSAVHGSGWPIRAIAPVAILATLTLATAACGVVSGTLRPTLVPPDQVDIARLWQEPVDLGRRSLYYGPGGQALMPDPAVPFTFVASDRSGYSGGYDVRGPDGMEWSVKLGREAQPEVAVSRILWALGYHQPPTYYLASWSLSGTTSGLQQGGRFRPKRPDREAVADWSWYENDFLMTQPFKGLVVANVMLNNWDWKTSNNKVYAITGQDVGAKQYRFVAQDLGASLGKTSYPKVLSWLPMRGIAQGSRNDLEDFEGQGFIKRVEGEHVDFYYRGIHQSLIDTLSPSDVVWICRLMARLSDAQWHDAFRAAGYTDEHSRRYVAKIKAKVVEGLTLAQS